MSRLTILLASVAASASVAAAAGSFPSSNLTVVAAAPAAKGPAANGPAGLAALAAINPLLEACDVASDVLYYCNDELPYDADLDEQASCYCCEGTTFLAPVYSSCEDYIATSAPAYTDDYSVVSVAQSVCLSVSAEGFRCGGGNVIATTTGDAFGASATGSSSEAVETFGATAVNTKALAACSSFASVYSSCEDSVRGFTTMDDAQAASCLCYKNGVYTTALDDYISECAVYIKTEDPDEYDSYVALETFCEVFSGQATTNTAVATFGGASNTNADLSFGSSTATSSTPTTTTTKSAPKTVTVTPTPTTTVRQGRAASMPAAAAGGGLAAWLAVVLPYVL